MSAAGTPALVSAAEVSAAETPALVPAAEVSADGAPAANEPAMDPVEELHIAPTPVLSGPISKAKGKSPKAGKASANQAPGRSSAEGVSSSQPVGEMSSQARTSPASTKSSSQPASSSSPGKEYAGKITCSKGKRPPSSPEFWWNNSKKGRKGRKGPWLHR